MTISLAEKEREMKMSKYPFIINRKIINKVTR